MIYDNIKNAHIYFPLGEKIVKALKYLQTTDFSTVAPGTYDIEGTDVYAIISEYNTKPLSSGKWESHKKYIDVQFLHTGKEKIGFSESKKMMLLEEYDSIKDVAIYKGEGHFVNVDENHFLMLFPTDVHMPGIAINIPKAVKKVVVKVSTDYIEIAEEEKVTKEETPPQVEDSSTQVSQ
ncbi:MAG: beta-D-galactosidase [Ignavibacteria bacterium]|nr:MAG: beta-D-galactosidase [Ignavibacteria bacterium]KAF0161848.1 MAG: beta-D-galactosidase [Ignavibacteria bacterium]